MVCRISVLGASLHSARGQQTQTKTVCETTGPEDLTCTIGTELYIVAVLYGRTGALPVTTCNPYNKQGMNMNCKQQGARPRETAVQRQVKVHRYQ